MYLFSEAESSGGGKMIMSRRKESDGLPAVYTRLWHLLSLGLSSLAGKLPQRPFSILFTHTHTLPTLTHIGALNRWQARQDYLGPLPGKTIGMWVRVGGACACMKHVSCQSLRVHVCLCTL